MSELPPEIPGFTSGLMPGGDPATVAFEAKLVSRPRDWPWLAPVAGGFLQGAQEGVGELWAAPARPTVTWHAHAVAYVAMKWPALSAHSRASVADALATITPALTRSAPGRPPAAVLRGALYACASNPARAAAKNPAAEAALAWAERASVPVARLADPALLRAALDTLAALRRLSQACFLAVPR
jgi:hypothetical protein